MIKLVFNLLFCEENQENKFSIIVARFTMIYGIILLSLLLSTVSSTAIPKADEHHNIDHLAHTNHLQNPNHDIKYDHEQFLGEDQAKTFDQLQPEESRRRLG